MIQQILPDAVLRNKPKVAGSTNFKAIQRFDPNSQSSNQLIDQNQQKEIKVHEKKEKMKKHETMIQKGVDKRKKKIMRANMLLGKSLGTAPEKKPIKKEIIWSKWKNISDDSEAANFSLFG